jgi:hypothetical protein
MRNLTAGLAVLVCLGFGCAKTGPGPDLASPCDGVTCSGHGFCMADTGQPRCACTPGFAATGLECLPSDPCAPNPCVGAHRTRCRPTARPPSARAMRATGT